MKKAGIKAANKVKANRKKKVVKDTMPEMTSIDVPDSPPQSVSCYGDWGGVTNSHSNGTIPKSKK
jgi:hypothetical protein